MPYVKRDWKMWLQRKICPQCIYYDVCMMDQDCKALEVLVTVHEDLDSGNPDD